MPSLICFTASYPYGERETYFTIELQYLAQKFSKIIIVPRYNPSGSDKQRIVPQNVEVLPPVVSQGAKRIVEGLVNTAPVNFYWRDFWQQKPFTDKGKLMRWGNSLLTFRKTYQVTKKLLHQYPNALLYAYWAETPLFVTRLTQNVPKVVRMHGGDFYTERNNGYLPLRQAIYDNAQLLLPISKNIYTRLQQQYHVDTSKLFLNYLGVNNSFSQFELRKETRNEPLILVSCSNLVPLKRVHRIAEALQNMPKTQPVVWHHFGDGPGMAELTALVNTLPKHITTHLHGWVQQADLFQFYNTHVVTWFVNVSQYEGLPVSIMEAFSAAIPVIATDVGGTAEIVNQNNGILLAKNFTTKELEQAILSAQHAWKGRSEAAFHSWESAFKAETNYKKLINKLQQL